LEEISTERGAFALSHTTEHVVTSRRRLSAFDDLTHLDR
jgi:hypothetical protein